MRIADIKASVHLFEIKVPLLAKPLRQYAVVCRLRSSDGATGIGVTGGKFLPHAVATALNHEFLPVITGLDVRDVEAIHEKVWWKLNQRTMTGVVSSALSCIDIACWDLHGRMQGRSIAQLLGGARDWIHTYCTFGFHEYDREQLVEAAKLQVVAGHRRLKMVVGVHQDGWQEDVRRLRAVRDAIGPDVELMMDANYKFNPVEAKLLCRAVEDLGIAWFEEPVYQNDAQALADLRVHTRIPIAAGQNEGHRWRLADLVRRQAVDLIQPNCCYAGGYTEARKVAHLAQAYNMPIAHGGGWPMLNMHLFAGLMNGWRLEIHLQMMAIARTMFKAIPEPNDNKLFIPAAPGLGLELNEDALRDTLVSV